MSFKNDTVLYKCRKDAILNVYIVLLMLDVMCDELTYRDMIAYTRRSMNEI